ncbi:MAG: hypothetical protein ABI901_07790, partial [Roseiflexaceae bacterium]
LAFHRKFANHPAAMAWLWKDHTSVAEAAQITELAKKMRPQFLAKCGGIYSSEWFWSKILHCLKTAPEVFNAAHSWIELADFVPATLTGTEHPNKFMAGVCAAGHKANDRRCDVVPRAVVGSQMQAQAGGNRGAFLWQKCRLQALTKPLKAAL